MARKPKTIRIATSNKALEVRGFFMLALLVLQFIAGMTLDIFIKLPGNHPGMAGSVLTRYAQTFAWSITNGGGIALTLHVILASVLVLGSVAALGFSIAAKNKAWIIAAVFGLLGVLSAFLNGLEFVSTNLDKHSFAMAMAFMIAFVSYALGIYFGTGRRS